MLYCEKCHRFAEGDTCPGCKRSRFLRAPREDDPVLLCVLRTTYADMVEPLLAEEKVPFSRLALGNSALLGGNTFLENYAFYVPCDAYPPPRGSDRLRNAADAVKIFVPRLKSPPACAMIVRRKGRGAAMLTIGICGASGSGKSTLADELARRLEEPCVLLKQDSYYKDHPDMDFAQRERINYDEPEAFEHEALRADLEALRAGKPITRKGYDYKLHRRCDSDDLIYPSDVVLLEGIHVFYDPAVRDLLDFKIFIQVDPDICLLRRVQRDIVERARHVDSVARQYLETVKPMFERYIRNYVEYADLIVARGGKNARIVDILAFYINSGMVKPET